MLNEKDRGKIALIGPPNSGKTTIKSVFFEMANPINLLQESLDPSKGVNASRFSFFKLELAIFDLAGQENNIWFSKDTDIFNGSNLIICIFDITNPLDSIFKFLVDFLNLISKLKLTSSKIVLFLHKADLVNHAYPDTVINFIKKKLESQGLNTYDLLIYITSIAKDYFFDSYTSIYKILNSTFEKYISKISEKEFDNLKNELLIIFKCKNSIRYYYKDIAKFFNLSLQSVIFHLDRLEHLGFITHPLLEPLSFYLTESAYWFKIGIKKIKENTLNNKSSYGIEIFHTFLNLNKVYSSIS